MPDSRGEVNQEMMMTLTPSRKGNESFSLDHTTVERGEREREREAGERLVGGGTESGPSRAMAP